MSLKLERIKKELQKEIMSRVVDGSIKDPRIPSIFSITKITISKDLHYAHVYFSMYGTEKEIKNAVAGFNSAKGMFQRLIARNLNLRFTPKLEFRYDTFEEQAYKVDRILREIAGKNEGNNIEEGDETNGTGNDDNDE